MGKLEKRIKDLSFTVQYMLSYFKKYNDRSYKEFLNDYNLYCISTSNFLNTIQERDIDSIRKTLQNDKTLICKKVNDSRGYLRSIKEIDVELVKDLYELDLIEINQ